MSFFEKESKTVGEDPHSPHPHVLACDSSTAWCWVQWVGMERGMSSSFIIVSITKTITTFLEIRNTFRKEDVTVHLLPTFGASSIKASRLRRSSSNTFSSGCSTLGFCTFQTSFVTTSELMISGWMDKENGNKQMLNRLIFSHF